MKQLKILLKKYIFVTVKFDFFHKTHISISERFFTKFMFFCIQNSPELP